MNGGRPRWVADMCPGLELDVPDPFDLGEFVTRLEARRQRPIWIRSFPAAPGVPCGMWISTATADHIWHVEGTTTFHATHIVLHELSHLLLGHQGGTQVWRDVIDLLVPALDARLVEVMLGRTAYTSAEERDAETLASLIHGGSGERAARLPAAGAQTGAFISVIERAWGSGSRAA